MEKEKFLILVFISISIITLVVFWYVGNFLRSNSLIFENNTLERDFMVGDNYSSVEEAHWRYMPLTFSYGNSCVGPIIERVDRAFEIIENDTEGLVSFKKVEIGGDIEFICYETQRVSDGFITEGLATTNISEDIINSAKIEFWSVSGDTRPQSCWNFPRLELQEILHTFNFGHVENNQYSVLYPYSVGCVAKDALITKSGKTFVPEDKLDDEVVSCLKYIYSNGLKGSCDDIKLMISGLCLGGGYPAVGTGFCCPELNMKIEDGYCVE